MNAKTIKLSILIPVYNAEPYLQTLFEALVKQWQPGVEVIALNDGSGDGSLRICEQYAAACPEWFRVITRQNCGVIRTRRDLLAASRGEWIWFVDSDDMISEDAVSFLLRETDRTDCDMILFDHYAVKDHATVYISQLPYDDGSLFSGDRKKEIYNLLIETSRVNNLCTKAFKRQIVDLDADYTSYKDASWGEDCIQIMPILTNAQRILYRKKGLYHYNQTNSGSLTHIFQMKTFYSLRKLWARKREHIDVWGIRESAFSNYCDQGWRVVLKLLAGALESRDSEMKFDDFFNLIVQDTVFSEIIDHPPTNRLHWYDRITANAVRERRQGRVRELLTARDAMIRVRTLLK